MAQYKVLLLFDIWWSSRIIQHRCHLRANKEEEEVTFQGLRLLRAGEIISGTKFRGTEVNLGHLSAENLLALTQHPAAGLHHLHEASVLSFLTVSTTPLCLHSVSTWVAAWPGSMTACSPLLHFPRGNQQEALLLTSPVHRETSDTVTLQQQTLMLLYPLGTYPQTVFTSHTYASLSC